MNTPLGVLLDASAGNDTVVVSLVRGQQMVGQRIVAFTANETQALLPELVDLLIEQQFDLHMVQRVAVVPGTNRFTVARLTAVMANGIGWSNQVPVRIVQSAAAAKDFLDADSSAESFVPVEAEYAKAPTIN